MGKWFAQKEETNTEMKINRKYKGEFIYTFNNTKCSRKYDIQYTFSSEKFSEDCST